MTKENSDRVSQLPASKKQRIFRHQSGGSYAGGWQKLTSIHKSQGSPLL